MVPTKVGYNNYWKLKFHDRPLSDALAERADEAFEDFPRTVRDGKIGQLKHGLPSYHFFDDDDLKGFLTERNIAVEKRKNRKTNRAHMITALEAADENRKVSYFLQLPAELRCLVYEEYLDFLPQNLHLPAQPPLGRVHPLIRSEILPLFYEQYPAIIGMQKHYNADDNVDLRIDQESWTFLLSHSKASFSEIRYFRFSIALSFATTSKAGNDHAVQIDLKWQNDAQRYEVAVDWLGECRYENWAMKKERLKRELFAAYRDKKIVGRIELGNVIRMKRNFAAILL